MAGLPFTAEEWSRVSEAARAVVNASFAKEPAKRVALYEQAKQVALAGGWVTYSIRISQARVLLRELGAVERALQELLECQGEIAVCADEGDRQEWNELHRECARRLGVAQEARKRSRRTKRRGAVV
jgi:hypothetical protein